MPYEKSDGQRKIEAERKADLLDRGYKAAETAISAIFETGLAWLLDSGLLVRDVSDAELAQSLEDARKTTPDEVKRLYDNVM